MIASVIHDIDHRGFSSTFMHDSGHPMGIVYGKISTLECHHFAFGCDVISRKGCNVFHRYTKQQAVEAYQVMERGVLATDLPEFFSTNAKLNSHLINGDLDISIVEHKSVLKLYIEKMFNKLRYLNLFSFLNICSIFCDIDNKVVMISIYNLSLTNFTFFLPNS